MRYKNAEAASVVSDLTLKKNFILKCYLKI